MVAVVDLRNSGKSSLIRVLGCLQCPYTGHVLVEGVSVRRLNNAQLAWIATDKFGFRNEDLNLMSQGTALENVEAWRRPKPRFNQLLRDNPDLLHDFNQRLHSLQETVYLSM